MKGFFCCSLPEDGFVRRFFYVLLVFSGGGVGWYDSEWGNSNRGIDLMSYMGKTCDQRFFAWYYIIGDKKKKERNEIYEKVRFRNSY